MRRSFRAGGVPLLPLCLFPFLQAAAAEGDGEDPLARCLAESGGGRMPVLACMEAELGRRERRLDRILRRLETALPPGRRQALTAVQEAWLAYRERKCRFLYHPASGSGGLEDLQQCLLDETARRIGELEALDARSGDSGPPVKPAP